MVKMMTDITNPLRYYGEGNYHILYSQQAQINLRTHVRYNLTYRAVINALSYKRRFLQSFITTRTIFLFVVISPHKTGFFFVIQVSERKDTHASSCIVKSPLISLCKIAQRGFNGDDSQESSVWNSYNCKVDYISKLSATCVTYRSTYYFITNYSICTRDCKTIRE